MPIDPTDSSPDATPGDRDDEARDEVNEGVVADDDVEFSAADLATLEALSPEELAELDAQLPQPTQDEDAALVARARKKYGTAGAILAGGMLGLDKLLTGKVKQEAPVEWEAPGEPLDIDRKGITVPIDDDAVVRSRPGPAAAAGATRRRVTRRRRP